MSMFKTMQNLRGVVTLFHDPGLQKSRQLAALIHDKYSDVKQTPFEVEITTDNPTTEQLSSLRGFTNIPTTVTPSTLPRPTLVAWFDGKAAVDDEPLAEQILRALASKKSE